MIYIILLVKIINKTHISEQRRKIIRYWPVLKNSSY